MKKLFLILFIITMFISCRIYDTFVKVRNDGTMEFYVSNNYLRLLNDHEVEPHRIKWFAQFPEDKFLWVKGSSAETWYIIPRELINEN